MSNKPSDSSILENVSNAIANVAEKMSPSVVRIGAGRWRGGTGTVWTKDGHIVTSNHVLGRGMSEIEVGFSDGTRHVAKVVGRDPYSDIALLKIDNDNLRPIEPGDSDSLKVGQLVLALANPMGQNASATYGIVTNPAFSARSWWGAPNKVVVSDTRLNPGYSGGPLVDARGRVIGINAAYANNRGISIPVNTVKQVVNQLMQDGKIKRAYLGIVADSINLPDDIANQQGVNQTSGLIVYSVDPDSAAKKAGLAMGDVIIKLDGKTVEDINALHEILTDQAIGKRMRLTILRGEKLTELTATPAESER